jgi:hypothetical protein
MIIVNENKCVNFKPVSRTFPEKIPWRVGTLSIIWGTTTRIIIIFGVPPHKYKYLK